MNSILFQALQLVVMIAVLVITRYVVPMIKNSIYAEKLEAIASWAMDAVLYAEQFLTASNGAEKKAVVTEFLKEQLTAKNIALSDEQLEVLIESAVKQMKIQEAGEIEVAVETDTAKEE